MWHSDGEQNTKFHHTLTKIRRARNQIICLKDKNGNWAERKEKNEEVSVQYFQYIFTSTKPSNFDESLRFITKKVLEYVNRFLVSILTRTCLIIIWTKLWAWMA